MKQFYEQLIQILEKNESLVLATVIGHKGSVPRSAGAKMAVCADGTILGTIGGGLVESKTIEKAKKTFDTRKSEIVDFDMTHNGLPKEKMICGGKLQILIQYIDASNIGQVGVFKKVVQAYENRTKSFLVTPLDGENAAVYLVSDTDDFPESLSAIEPAAVLAIEKPSVIEATDAQIWCEPLTFPPKLYLFGGGHVSRAIANISHTVDFETVVVDDRPEIIEPAFFPNNCQLELISDFENCFEHLNIEAGSYIVIVTRGHVFDMQVLKQAINAKAAYIGMMGSRRKRNTIYDHLIKQGITQEQLDAVHSPIGLNINAETPAELAVSILGELIQVRHQ